MKCPVLLGAMLLLYCVVYGEYCTESYTCTISCYRQSKTYRRCGFLWLNRCAKYSSYLSSCSSTCTRQVCCDNWTGDDCLTPICYGSTTCPNGGTCMTPNTCACATGFAPPACRDINECSSGNGGCEQICTNTYGSFICSCNDGYTLGYDKKTCYDNNECLFTNNGGCQQKCVNLPGSYRCECYDGYFPNSDGKTCSDIDECVGIECLNGGTCVDGLKSYKCLCRNGYTGNLCQSDVDECQLLNGGCQDICTNVDGSFECSCFDNRALHSNGISCKGVSNTYSVFQKYNITGKGLPRGCWLIQIAKCSDGENLNVTLSSTSPWLTAEEYQGLHFTYGIVFAEGYKLSIPISLDGVEVQSSTDSFNIRLGVRAEFTNLGSTVGTQRLDNCISFNFSSSDRSEFIEAESFLRSVFVSVIGSLPNWLQFANTNTSVLKVNNMKTDLVYGRDIDSVPSCRGAPIFPNNMYSVFTFGTDFAVEIYGHRTYLPKPLSGEDFCLIVDICQTYGGTVFLILPKEAPDILSTVSSFKTLFTDQGIYIQIHGIGFSLSGGINVFNNTRERRIWNGGQIIKSSVTDHANVWIGGDFVRNKSSSLFEATGQADMFLTVPSVHTFLTAVFLEEWNGLVSVRFSTSTLNLELFGQRFQLPFNNIINTPLDVYMSVGGTGQRSICGETGNMPGIFFNTTLKDNPFPNVPILNDWDFNNTNKAYFVFFILDYNIGDTLAVDILFDDIIGLANSLNRLNNFVGGFLDDIKYFITSNIKLLLRNVATAVRNVIVTVQMYFQEIWKGYLNISQRVNMLDEIWKNITSLQNHVELFISSVELFVDVPTDNATVRIQSEIKTINDKFKEAVDHHNQQVNSLVQDYDAFGLKCNATANLYGLTIPGLDVEFVTSRRSFSCTFDEVFELLKDKKAARILATVTKEIKLGYFFRLERGVGVKMAFAKESNEVILKVQVFAHILGVRAIAALFITNEHVSLYTELNVWNNFLAHIDIIAEHGRDWYDLILQIRGRFDAKAQNNTSFQYSYLDDLKKVATMISDEADIRLSQAQKAVTVAQFSSTKSQNLLEEKKKDVQKDNTAFDWAVNNLEYKKRELEQTEAPYYRVLSNLEEIQKDVDKLCKPLTCGTFCIQGIKCNICKKKVRNLEIPFPCCRFTKCMIRLPNPLCVAANALCEIVRGIAYLALEADKGINRAVILAYDATKLAVTVAQVIVDKSRVVHTLAEGVLTLAQVGLEGVKGVLEVAKVTLEAIKATIGAAVKVQIHDVRNCGFDIELSTGDLQVFDVSCEVNAYKLGWKTFRIRINFKNIFQSIWQAAKATIKAIIDVSEAIFSDRKRRELSLGVVVNSTESTAIDSIDTHSYNDGFANGQFSDYDNRVDLFRLKCQTITKVLAFFNETFNILFDIANETNHGIEESQLAKSQLQQYNFSGIANSLTLEEAGINSQIAYDDYRITEAELDQALGEGKSAVANNPLIGEIVSSLQWSSHLIDSEMSAAESVQMHNQWLFAMYNTTNAYFNKNECVGFPDCVYHSVTLIYDLYTEEQMPERDTVHRLISTMEYYILDIFQNTSLTISRIFNATSALMSNIQLISDLNQFCSQPPVFTASAENHTVEIGSDASIPCHVSADPAPTFWWYKDGNLMVKQTTNILRIQNASLDDKAGYFCVAGNIVANITSDEMHLHVILTITNSLDPKRRELSFVATSKIHKFLRQVRSQDEVVNSTESAAIDFIDTLSYNDGFANGELSDYNNRVDLFRLKCQTITKVLAFFNETFLILFDIANETNHGVEESQLAKSQLQQYSSSDIANNLTLEEAGINIQNAYDDYNITEADLDQALKEGKAAIVNDSLLGEIESSVQLSSDHIDSEMSAAESVQILIQWIFAMENTTNSYFNESECVRFHDCIYHSIALLYDLYIEEQVPEMDTVLGAISSLENYLLDVLQNASSSISETFNASSVIMSNIHLLSDLNLFCSQPPVFTVSAENHTVEIGSNASIPCHVSADPAPTFWWYKDGNLMIEQTTNILWIHNVSHDDTAVYICVAGNIVANITSDEMHLRIITHIEPPDGPEDRKDFPLLAVILVPTLFCVLAVSAVIIIVRWYRNRKTNTQSGRSVRRGGVNTSGDCNMHMDTLRPQREPSNEYTDLDTVGTPAVEPSTRESSRPDFYAGNAGYGYVIDT